MNTLGVAAPLAAQRAGFEENSRANAWSIMGAKMLDVQHDAPWLNGGRSGHDF
jgi:hypothetical protein